MLITRLTNLLAMTGMKVDPALIAALLKFLFGSAAQMLNVLLPALSAIGYYSCRYL